MEMFRTQMTKAHNSRARPHAFQVGDLVMRMVDVQRPIDKLDPEWKAHIGLSR